MELGFYVITLSASLNENRDKRSARVATRLVLASAWPTQLRAPSAKGK